MDLKQFQNPDPILRPAPFWAINDRVTPEESARQMEEMLSVGLSGGFFHSRSGLVTDYLSPEWFAAMRAALKAAKEHNGYLWLYDEDRWPSGNAGGLVAGMKDEYRAAALEASLIPAGAAVPPDTADTALQAVYALRERDRLLLKRFDLLPKGQNDLSAERLVLRRRYEAKSDWWNGESYANLLNAEAMQEFIRMTHDVYAREFQEEFGKRIPGIFTDEPQLMRSRTGIPFTASLPADHSQWTGRDFWQDVPFLFFDGPDARTARLFLHRTVLNRFCESFCRPIFEWCQRHGLDHTGHFMFEDSLESQIRTQAGGVMAGYRWLQSPGIDHLSRQTHGMLLTVKQASSAARQLGRTRVLDEIFGVSRHTNTFEDFKWLGDFDLVLGANFLVPHLTWYSARGRRKRDYPPVWNYQQTYWKDLNPLNDYFTRIAAVLTSGTPVVPVLLLHPIEGAIAARRIGVASDGSVRDLPQEDLSEARRLDERFRHLLASILNSGLDCDLGDEGFLADLARVENGRFRVGEMIYDAVVVPPSPTWRPGTFDLLKKFAGQGGRLILCGNLPVELDGQPAPEWTALASTPGVRTIPDSAHNIVQALDAAGIGQFRLRGRNGRPVADTYVQARRDNGDLSLFIVNSSRDRWGNYVLVLPGASGKGLGVLDPLDGSVSVADAQMMGKDLQFRFSLPPCGSLLLATGVVSLGSVARTSQTLSLRKTVPLPRIWKHRRLDPNVLVIDRVDASVDGGQTWMGEDLEFRVRRKTAEHFGTETALWWQPWFAARKGIFAGKGGPLTLRYRFQSDLERVKNAWVVLEDLERGTLKVNGTPVDTRTGLWHWDRAFGKAEISSLVQKGDNTVEFTLPFDFMTEVEAAYVIGDFGVALSDPYRGKLVEETRELTDGSWADQTYPFYSGRMVYAASFETETSTRTFLHLNQPSAVLSHVRINGKPAGSLFWQPFELDISSRVQNGKNTLEIELISSLQNSWGPLHERTGDDNHWCGPNAFEEEGDVREEFSLFHYGLLGGAELIKGVDH